VQTSTNTRTTATSKVIYKCSKKLKRADVVEIAYDFAIEFYDGKRFFVILFYSVAYSVRAFFSVFECEKVGNVRTRRYDNNKACKGSARFHYLKHEVPNTAIDEKKSRKCVRVVRNEIVHS